MQEGIDYHSLEGWNTHCRSHLGALEAVHCIHHGNLDPMVVKIVGHIRLELVQEVEVANHILLHWAEDFRIDPCCNRLGTMAVVEHQRISHSPIPIGKDRSLEVEHHANLQYCNLHVDLDLGNALGPVHYLGIALIPTDIQVVQDMVVED